MKRMSGPARFVVLVAVAGGASVAAYAAVQLSPQTSSGAPLAPISLCVEQAAGTKSDLAAVISELGTFDGEFKAAHDEEMAKLEALDGADRPWPGLSATEHCPRGIELPEVRSQAPTSFTRLDGFVVKTPLNEPPSVQIRLAIVPDGAPFLRGATYLRQAYEAMCEPEGLPCREVSTALYVADGALADGKTLREAVINGLGLLHSPDGRPDAGPDDPAPEGKTLGP